MSESKHTPGPWLVCDDGEPNEPMLKVVGRTARHEIALCCTDAVPQDEETANARLIAAAPAMLEALNLARIELGAWLQVGAGPSTKRTFDVVRAAIALAAPDAQVTLVAPELFPGLDNRTTAEMMFDRDDGENTDQRQQLLVDVMDAIFAKLESDARVEDMAVFSSGYGSGGPYIDVRELAEAAIAVMYAEGKK
jgi:hypothetical protein